MLNQKVIFLLLWFTQGYSSSVNYDVSSTMPYEFGYGVNDAYTGDAKEHKETTENGRTEGEYRWLQPNGLFRVVRYYVDGHSGFIAEVTEEEEPKLKNYMFNNLKSGINNQPLVESHSQQIFSYQDKNGNGLFKQMGFKNSMKGNSYSSSQINFDAASPQILQVAPQDHYQLSHQQSLFEINQINKQSKMFAKMEDNREPFNEVPLEQFSKLHKVLPTQMTHDDNLNPGSSQPLPDTYRQPITQLMDNSFPLRSININMENFRNPNKNLLDFQQHQLNINENKATPQEHKFGVQTNGQFESSLNNNNHKSSFIGYMGKTRAQHRIQIQQRQQNQQISKLSSQQQYMKQPVTLNIVPIQSFLKNNPQYSKMVSFNVIPRALSRANPKLNIASNFPKSSQHNKNQFRTISTNKLPYRNLENILKGRQTHSNRDRKQHSVIKVSGKNFLRSLSRFSVNNEMKFSPEIIQRLAGKINLLPLEAEQNQLINPKVVTTQLFSSLKHKDSSNEKGNIFVAPKQIQNLKSENPNLQQNGLLNDNNSNETNLRDVITDENENIYRDEPEEFEDSDFREEDFEYSYKDDEKNYENAKSLSSDDEAETSSYTKINR